MARTNHLSQPKPKFVRLAPKGLRAYETDPTASMFIQDIQLAIMPYRNHRDPNKSFHVAVSGTDEAQAKMRSILNSLGGSDAYCLEEALSDSIRKLANYLAWQGDVAFEIVMDQETGNVYLSHFSDRSVYRLLNYCVQIQPEDKLNNRGHKFVVLHERMIFRMQLPSELGGRRGHLRTLRRLRNFPRIMPECFRRDLEDSNQLPRFGFQEYRREVELYHYIVTRKWGWDLRDYNGDNTTELTRLYRKLNYKRAQAVLRNHILNELNALAKKLGIDAKISVTGLLQPDEILAIRDAVVSGDISFDEAYQKVINAEN